MLRRVRGTLAGLAFGSTVAAGVVFGTVCSVDRAGLSNGDASISFGGSSGGASSTGGIGGAAGIGGGGKGGTTVVATGGVAGGAGGASSTGGAPETGGNNGATGGSTGTGGESGSTGGTLGTGGMSGGTGGAPATGGAPGTGGAPATGGAPGTGGAPATGGAPGTGGAPATGGAMGMGGTGGSHPPSCASFPKGSMFVTPTDNLPHCYWTHSEQTDWDSSEASCVSDGGTLATILSSQENMFVLSVLLQPNLFNGLGVSIGATDGRASSDKSGAGTYAWVTGEPWSYQNWHMDHPDGACTCQGSTSCTCNHWLVMFNDGTWWDRPEKVARPYICEAIAR